MLKKPDIAPNTNINGTVPSENKNIDKAREQEETPGDWKNNVSQNRKAEKCFLSGVDIRYLKIFGCLFSRQFQRPVEVGTLKIWNLLLFHLPLGIFSEKSVLKKRGKKERALGPN